MQLGPSLSQVSRGLGASLPHALPAPQLQVQPGLGTERLGGELKSPCGQVSPAGPGRECPPLVLVLLLPGRPPRSGVSRDGGRVVAHRRPCTPPLPTRSSASAESTPRLCVCTSPGEEVCVFFWVLRFSKAFCDSELVKCRLWV